MFFFLLLLSDSFNHLPFSPRTVDSRDLHRADRDDPGDHEPAGWAQVRLLFHAACGKLNADADVQRYHGADSGLPYPRAPYCDDDVRLFSSLCLCCFCGLAV